MKSVSIVRLGAASSWVLALTLAQCGTPSINGSSGDIGAQGGRVALATGASVQVPAGALSTMRTITVREAGATAVLPEQTQLVGNVLVLGPEGQTFATPVSITLPTTSAANVVYTRPVGATEWTLVEDVRYDEATHSIIARVSHFSEFAPGHRAPRCHADSDCAAGYLCVSGACQRTSMPDAGDASVDASVPACRTDSECAAGQRCVSGVCSTSGCPAGRIACGTSCVDLQSDVSNCGACGVACAAGSVCTAGVCSGSHPDAGDAGPLGCRADSECAAGQLCVAGVCTIAGHDAGDAGPPSCSADRDCPAGYLCRAGVCSSIGMCSAPNVLCGATCTNLLSDPHNCGACGASCLAGYTCTAGVCSGSHPDAGDAGPLGCRADSECAAGQLCVAGVCTIAGHDAGDAGPPSCGADSDCAAGERCVSGVCVGTIPDAGSCASDSDCLAGQLCVSGTCLWPSDGGSSDASADGGFCAVPQIDCGGVCIDLSSDPHNCGTCGASCLPGRSCVAGACR